MSPEAELDALIARYSPPVADMARAALREMRKRVPGAFQLVYDMYALAIGFGPTERTSEAVLSIVVYPHWVNLCFFEGAFLPDPRGVLKGSGKQVRHIRLTNAADLGEPAVQALITEALKRAEKPFPSTGPGQVVIRTTRGARKRR